jgi:hypothetical protein
MPFLHHVLARACSNAPSYRLPAFDAVSPCALSVRPTMRRPCCLGIAACLTAIVPAWLRRSLPDADRSHCYIRLTSATSEIRRPGTRAMATCQAFTPNHHEQGSSGQFVSLPESLHATMHNLALGAQNICSLHPSSASLYANHGTWTRNCGAFQACSWPNTELGSQRKQDPAPTRPSTTQCYRPYY